MTRLETPATSRMSHPGPLRKLGLLASVAPISAVPTVMSTAITSPVMVTVSRVRRRTATAQPRAAIA